MEKLKTLLLVTGVTVITLLLSEIGLRLAGHEPAKMTDSFGFTQVDSLYELKGMEADKEGLFRVTGMAAKEVAAAIKNNRESKEQSPDLFDYSVYNVEQYGLANQYLDIIKGHYQNDFCKWLQPILQKKNKSALDSLIIEYVTHPINEYGYRSLPFRKVATHQPTVLLLGNSYTWGHSTKNITNSFADLLLTKGYVVYNAGIGGTDPLQYLAVAKKYLPLLKPDLVLVNFTTSSDVKYYDYKLKPYVPTYWITNAGYLYSCINGVYYNTKEEVYHMQVQSSCIPNTTGFNRFCRKTAIGTLVWNALKGNVSLDTEPEILLKHNAKAKKFATTLPTANRHMQELQLLADSNGCRLVICCIPKPVFKKFGDFSLEYAATHSKLFDSITYNAPVFAKEDFTPPDHHFNDKGHAKYANYLTLVLDSIFHAGVSMKSHP